MIKRPLVIITISYIIGIIMGLYLKINAALFFFLCLIVIVIAYKFFSKYFDSRAKFNVGIFLGVFLAIFMSYFIVHIKENSFKLLYSDVAPEVSARGIVEKILKESEYYDNYVIRVNSIGNSTKFHNTNILLKVKKNKGGNPNKLEYGDSILVNGMLEKPEVRRNFKGFDYSQYLKTKNIYRICKSDYEDIKVINKNSLSAYKMWINMLQNRLKSNLNNLLEEENANVANAVLLGSSETINEEQRQTFNNASLIHVLAISGMHVTYVVLFWNLVLKKTDKRKTKYFLILFLIFFASLTGGSPSVVRATIMSGIAIGSKLVYRKSDTINNIAISCLVILIINPYDILNLGFQLSFLGTLGIVLFNSKITDFVQKVEWWVKEKYLKKYNVVCRDKVFCKVLTKVINNVKSIIMIGISANLLMMPVLIYNSNTCSLVFIVSTILITPILGIMILTGYLTTVISIISMKFASIIAIPFKFLINLFKYIAELSSNIAILRFTVVTPSLIEMIIYYFLIFYFFLFYQKKHNKVIIKALIFFTVLCIVSKTITYTNHGLRLYFIDVGQGDSCLIITETNQTILIDGGGSETSSYDVGKNVLVPYLLDRKIKKIDYIIFSHFDSDHCKGLFTVMEELQVRNVVVSEQGEISDNYKYFIKLVKDKKLNLINVSAR